MAKKYEKNRETEKRVSLTFEEIYRQYSDKILNLAYRMTGGEEAARDLTQDVFVKVLENMGNFRGESQVYTWIYRIATNHIINYLRKGKRRRLLNLMDKSLREVLREDTIEPTFWGGWGPPGPDRKLEKTERDKIIWSIVQSLPLKFRMPLVLFRYEGMSYKEISDTMGLSLSAVETRIHRGRKELVKKLEPWIKEL